MPTARANDAVSTGLSREASRGFDFISEENGVAVSLDFPQGSPQDKTAQLTI